MATLTCPDCDYPGSGNCAVCRGKGKVPGDGIAGASETLEYESPCSLCGGSGECQTCNGMGQVEVGGEGG